MSDRADEDRFATNLICIAARLRSIRHFHLSDGYARDNVMARQFCKDADYLEQRARAYLCEQPNMAATPHTDSNDTANSYADANPTIQQTAQPCSDAKEAGEGCFRALRAERLLAAAQQTAQPVALLIERLRKPLGATEVLGGYYSLKPDRADEICVERREAANTLERFNYRRGDDPCREAELSDQASATSRGQATSPALAACQQTSQPISRDEIRELREQTIGGVRTVEAFRENFPRHPERVQSDCVKAVHAAFDAYLTKLDAALKSEP